MQMQISQSATAMSPGRHLLECLPLYTALVLRGVYRMGAGRFNPELLSPVFSEDGCCWEFALAWTPESCLLVCLLVPLLGIWSWVKRLMDL